VEFAFLWVGLLVSGLLANVMVTGLSAHLKKPFWRKIWPVITFAFVAVFFICVTTVISFLYYKGLQPEFYFWFWISLTLCYIIGSGFVLKKGFGDIKTDEPKARLWNWRRNFYVLIIACLATWFIFSYLYNHLLNEMDKIGLDATCRINSIIPQSVPDSLNSYPLYIEAAEGLKKIDQKWLRHYKSDIDSAERSKFLFEQRHTLALIYQAASRPYYQYETDLNAPILDQPLCPSFIDYRLCAYFLNHSAIEKSRHGDISGALRDLEMMKVIKGHLWQYPYLINGFIGIAIDAIRVDGLEFVLANSPAGTASSIVLPVKEDKSSLELMHKTFYTEHLLALQMVSGIIRDGKESESGITDTFFGQESFYSKYVTVRPFLNLLSVPMVLNDNKKISVLLAKPVKTYQELYENVKKTTDLVIRDEIFFSLAWSPGHESDMCHYLKHDARQGLATLALATTAYKIKNGHYPEKTEELVPQYIEKIPADPFDGRPLKMKAVKGGLDLYSVSFNDKCDKAASGRNEPIHFYLGKEAYFEYRTKPAIAKEKLKKKSPEK
jgi:hypothetical protein